MVATLQWQNSTAASATYSTVTKLRFKAANNNTDDLVNPLIKPTAGTNYSFEKSCRINVSVAPSTQLSNLRVLLSVHPVQTGFSVYYGFQVLGSYTQPIGTVSSVATTELQTSEVSWANSGTFTTTGMWGDIVIFQVRLATTVSGGESTDFTIIARYDEI